jgi:RNase adapter protein RapZ
MTSPDPDVPDIDVSRPDRGAAVPPDADPQSSRRESSDRHSSGGHPPERQLVIVTGLSGAGRSTALKALEDLGFEAIDNLPLSLLEALLRQRANSSGTAPGPEDHRLAVGIDSRTRDLAPAETLTRLRTVATQFAFALDLLFLDCRDDLLIRRFSVTRRRHPLEPQEDLAVSIARERQRLYPLREVASQIIDTSALSPQELRGLLAARYARRDARGLVVQVVSFSYKRGLPPMADMVFDMRFLRNPHYDPILSELTGKDPAVADFIAADPLYPQFLMRLQELLHICLEGWMREGKSYVTLAFGCSGGKHRSVCISTAVARWLAAAGWPVTIHHLEIAA